MTFPFARELSIWADFNMRDEHGRIKTSLRFVEEPPLPSEGEWIRLRDDEGNMVMGLVEEIEGMIIRVRPEMATWTSTDIDIAPFVSQAEFRAGQIRTGAEPVST